MIDERIFLIILPAIFLWCITIPSHRTRFIKSDKINVGHAVAFLAGSRTNLVSRQTFGLQLGYLSMIFWYIILRISNFNYLITNAYVFSILLGAITGLILQRVLKLFSITT